MDCRRCTKCMWCVMSSSTGEWMHQKPSIRIKSKILCIDRWRAWTCNLMQSTNKAMKNWEHAGTKLLICMFSESWWLEKTILQKSPLDEWWSWSFYLRTLLFIILSGFRNFIENSHNICQSTSIFKKNSCFTYVTVAKAHLTQPRNCKKF